MEIVCSAALITSLAIAKPYMCSVYIAQFFTVVSKKQPKYFISVPYFSTHLKLFEQSDCWYHGRLCAWVEVVVVTMSALLLLLLFLFCPAKRAQKHDSLYCVFGCERLLTNTHISSASDSDEQAICVHICTDSPLELCTHVILCMWSELYLCWRLLWVCECVCVVCVCLFATYSQSRICALTKQYRCVTSDMFTHTKTLIYYSYPTHTYTHTNSPSLLPRTEIFP